jgi:bifunctional polynucleotide phosphatase/kinase
VTTPVKIAAFDMDWTIIKTQSGATFPKDKNDWDFLYDDLTKDKLLKLSSEGFEIVVFSNQAGVESGRTKVSDLEFKFSQI